jgi:CopG family transcriptional regulator / antitoxin EndoAI
MNQHSVRVNITLPKGLLQALDALTGARNRSRFIREAVEVRIAQREKEALDAQLAEGYRAGREESLRIAETFETVDLEGWGDY